MLKINHLKRKMKEEKKFDESFDLKEEEIEEGAGIEDDNENVKDIRKKSERKKDIKEEEKEKILQQPDHERIGEIPPENKSIQNHPAP